MKIGLLVEEAFISLFISNAFAGERSTFIDWILSCFQKWKVSIFERIFGMIGHISSIIIESTIEHYDTIRDV